MQKCKKCSQQFGWKSIIKSIWLRLYAPIICDKCNTKHYADFSTKLIVAFSLYIPVLINKYVYNIFGYYSIIIYIIWIVAMICITPFIAKYHIKNQEK